MFDHSIDERARLMIALASKITAITNERGSCAQCATVAIAALLIQHVADFRLDIDAVMDAAGAARLRAQRLMEAANSLGYTDEGLDEAKRLGRLS